MPLQLLRSLFDLAVANDLNVVRCFAFAVSPEYALQPNPGQYNEAIFRGLDYALDQLRSRGLKVRLLSLSLQYVFLLALCPEGLATLRSGSFEGAAGALTEDATVSLHTHHSLANGRVRVILRVKGFGKRCSQVPGL